MAAHEDHAAGAQAPQQVAKGEYLQRIQTVGGLVEKDHLGIMEEGRAKADGRVATDDAKLVGWLGAQVTIGPGETDNKKITFAKDLAAAGRRLDGAPGQKK